VLFLEADESHRPARIRKVNVSTGGATTIDTEADVKCPWIFDLDRISERQDGTIIFLDKIPSSFCGQALVSIRADGSQKKVIANATSNDHFYSPSWSPDGKQIALRVYNLIPSTATPGLTIRILNADGTGQRDIVSLPRDTQYTHEPEGDALCWSADQTRLLFAVFEPGGGYHTYSIKPDGTDLTQIAAAFTLSCAR
jgi:dipeptidyl aminopeptidase/acylaminoacyl peptidase